MYMSSSTHNRIQHSNLSKQLRNALTVPNVDAKITVRPASFHDLMVNAQFFCYCSTNRPASTND